jgi:threonyl-tRNA synthetase
VLGSLERFIAIYLEHTGGDLPTWLAPQQVLVLPVAERHEDVAERVRATLAEAGIRAEVDARNETLGYRVRSGELGKVPYLVVVGDAEAESASVTVRRRHSGEQQKLGLVEFRDLIQEEVRTRGIS